jgi:GH15 family glucan-1,4-alpha-glucosidase
MAWVAFDRAIKTVETSDLEGPVEHWRTCRAEIHDAICREGFNQQIGAFVQYFGGDTLDASLLMMPAVGFLPPHDPRLKGTVEAIEKSLVHDGFVLRYRTHETDDGLPPGEGSFLPCSFWLVDNLTLLGRHEEAAALFEKLLSIRNDLGLLSEEYDPVAGRLVGNFPQAFTHVGLVNSARNLSAPQGPAEHRRK